MAEGKIIDLKRNVHALCKEYPELVGLLADLGFTDIVKPGMLESAGRFMTIPLGARVRSIDLDQIIQKLQAAGFSIED